MAVTVVDQDKKRKMAFYNSILEIFGPAKAHSKFFDNVVFIGESPIHWNPLENRVNFDKQPLKHPIWLVKISIIQVFCGLPFAFFFGRHFLLLHIFGVSPDKMDNLIVMYNCVIMCCVGLTMLLVLAILGNFNEFNQMQKHVPQLIQQFSLKGLKNYNNHL